ncbi:MAG: WD40/YVTN/BNR-like repeat-containing protein [Dermatophilaceae bacterium]
MMRTRTLVPLLSAAALAAPLGIMAVGETDGEKVAATAATAERAVASPVGAEEWMFRQRANPDGAIPDAAVQEAVGQSRTMGTTALRSATTDQVWKELGPSNIGGRIRDVAADPTTKNVVYIATGTGGLWRTDNAGKTFETAWNDQYPQSMGAVAVDSKGVVWAGTGEPDHGGGSSYYGDGVYRSEDNGAT